MGLREAKEEEEGGSDIETETDVTGVEIPYAILSHFFRQNPEDNLFHPD